MSLALERVCRQYLRMCCSGSLEISGIRTLGDDKEREVHWVVFGILAVRKEIAKSQNDPRAQPRALLVF